MVTREACEDSHKNVTFYVHSIKQRAKREMERGFIEGRPSVKRSP